MSRYVYDERREQAELFGAMMEERRLALEMTRKELSRRSGVSKSSLDNYAVGRCEPCAFAIVRIADALGCSADFLLGRCRAWKM